jgi:heme-degrading monooxygenase HmoA
MHVIVWAYEVVPETRAEFVAAYRGEGAWAALFTRGKGYLGTELLSARDDENRFLTIDRWASVDDFERFKDDFGDAYRALDAALERLTVSENRVASCEGPL